MLASRPEIGERRESVFFGLGPPSLDGVFDYIGYGHQAVVAPPETILTFYFFGLKLASPGGVHDFEDCALIRSPGQRKKLARSQRAEGSDQEDGPVAHVCKTR